jgi:beta-galactosidase/beta-glucuronidase
VAVRLEQLPGLSGGAAIPEPVVFACEKGQIKLGNLFENESFKTYSGGMWYRKTISLTKKQADSKNVLLNLGRIVASAEVIVNGKSVGIKAMSPWEFDLTGKIRAGENQIEILVYNTLGNHFLTTPSQYIGRTDSGLMGPVKLVITEQR